MTNDERTPTEPPPNPTVAALRNEFTSFRRDLFAYFEDAEKHRRAELGITLDQRDANVLEHFRQIRGDITSFRTDLTTKFQWWKAEFRGRTHGFRNAFLVIVDKLRDLEERVAAIDGHGIEDIDISKLLEFHQDTEPAGPPEGHG